ncbi:MAG: pyrimidine 5'-nucleotidase [Treponema sp.]|jgi:putative hydrolase of the HAD superfamily|nr:pyrimidine 5'-nucleotidase [Treponema sp.]
MQNISYLFFDLDNTLYPASLGLEKAVNRRVNEYIAEMLGLSMEDAWALRKERIKARGYGTTIEWLVAEKKFDRARLEQYFAYIHPLDDADPLSPDPALRSLLLSFKRPMAILTNSPREHAERVLDRLALRDIFTSIFDIRYNGLKGKPSPDAFERAFKAAGTTAQNCLFVDDSYPYVEGYRRLGGPGVLIDELDERPDFPAPRIRALEELRNYLD